MPEHDAHGHGDAHGAHGEHESPLETMLHALSDDSIANAVTVPHREARESFNIENHKITDYEEFVRAISSYVKHHKKNAERTTEEVSDQHAFAEAYTALQQVFRNQGGMKHAIELAKKGQFRDVIDAIANQIERRAGEEYRFLHTEGKVAPDDFDTKTTIVRDLFGRMKTLDPSLNLGKPELFAHEYEGVVARYNELVRSVREMYGAREAPHDEHDAHGHAADGHGAAHAGH